MCLYVYMYRPCSPTGTSLPITLILCYLDRSCVFILRIIKVVHAPSYVSPVVNHMHVTNSWWGGTRQNASSFPTTSTLASCQPPSVSLASHVSVFLSGRYHLSSSFIMMCKMCVETRRQQPCVTSLQLLWQPLRQRRDQPLVPNGGLEAQQQQHRMMGSDVTSPGRPGSPRHVPCIKLQAAVRTAHTD